MTKSPYLNFALNSFLRFLLLAPFNFFIIAFPALITFTLILLVWAVALTLFAASFTLPFWVSQTEFISLTFWSALATFSTSIFSFFASIALGLAIFFISKHFSIYMYNYIRWNLNYIFRHPKAT